MLPIFMKNETDASSMSSNRQLDLTGDTTETILETKDNLFIQQPIKYVKYPTHCKIIIKTLWLFHHSIIGLKILAWPFPIINSESRCHRCRSNKSTCLLMLDASVQLFMNMGNMLAYAYEKFCKYLFWLLATFSKSNLKKVHIIELISQGVQQFSNLVMNL